VIPFTHELEQWEKEGKEVNFGELFPLLMGQTAGAVREVQSAKQIVEEFVTDAVAAMTHATSQIVSKL
jgi:hypothetical protein